MTYGKFAYLYDELMKDVPYEEWVQFINKQAKTYGIEGKKLLDLACGTGELSFRLAEEGYACYRCGSFCRYASSCEGKSR